MGWEGGGEAGAVFRHKAKAFCLAPPFALTPQPGDHPCLPGEVGASWALAGTAPRTGPS